MKKINNKIKVALKIVLTIGSIYFVFTKINIDDFLATISRIKVIYFVLALLTFNVSKIISSFRLNHLYQAISIYLPTLYNIKLTYVGMYYNLFLPGAIGGDGYKVFLLRQNHDVKTKLLIGATLLDRISGVTFLAIFACIFVFFSSFIPPFPYFDLVILAVLVVSVPILYFVIKYFFPTFLKKFYQTSYLSLGVQATQVICAIFLLLSLSVRESYIDYLTLFMISSVIAVLPITLGGVGAREMVFFLGHQYLHINEASAIAFSVLFFLVTAISSIFGLFFSFSIDKPVAVNSEKDLLHKPAPH